MHMLSCSCSHKMYKMQREAKHICLTLLKMFSLPECIYRKRMSVDGRQLNVELYDPCSQVSVYSSSQTSENEQ